MTAIGHQKAWSKTTSINRKFRMMMERYKIQNLNTGMRSCTAQPREWGLFSRYFLPYYSIYLHYYCVKMLHPVCRGGYQCLCMYYGTKTII